MITGANGFIGKAVIDTLASSHDDIIAISRKASAEPVDNNIRFVTCDLLDYDSLEGSLTDCDLVIHLAADMHSENMYENTITATENLLAAMKTTGVNKLILCSSMSVLNYASQDALQTIDETVPVCDDDNLLGRYAQMKRDQEQLVNDWKSDVRHALILRPGLVYDDNVISTDHMGIKKSSLALISSHKGQVPLIHLNSVAQAFAAACQYNFNNQIKLLHLIDDKAPLQQNYINKLRALGSFSVGIKVHWKLYCSMLGFVRLLLKLAGKSHKIPDAFRINSMYGRATPFQFSNSLAKRTLDWMPMNTKI